jgi:hypothetical protein
MRIGEFGAAKRELSGEKDDFVFCGERFVVESPMPAVLALQLGAAVSGKIDETEGFAAMWEALRVSLTIPRHHRLATPADVEQGEADENGQVEVPESDEPFKRFYKLATDNGIELDPLMRVVMALFEAQTGRPTKPAPASLGGPPTTSPSSNASSTPEAPSHLRSVDDLIRGNVIQMGDGQIVEYKPAEQTG